MIVLDTNVFSEMMRNPMDGHVEHWLSSQDPAEFAITSVTRAEVRYGLARLPAGKRRTDLQRLADILFAQLTDRSLIFDNLSADRYGEIVARQETSERPIGIFGAQIAAICGIHGATIATRNVQDFADTGVTIVNPFGS